VPVNAPLLLTGLARCTVCQLINRLNRLHSADSVLIVRGSRKPYFASALKMISLILAFTFKFLVPLLVLIAVIDAISATQPQKIRRLSMAGHSQRSIAERLGVTRYRVRLALA
jgi:hypothetical protein